MKRKLIIKLHSVFESKFYKTILNVWYRIDNNEKEFQIFFFLYLDTKFPINTSNSMLIIEQIKNVKSFAKFHLFDNVTFIA